MLFKTWSNVLDNKGFPVLGILCVYILSNWMVPLTDAIFFDDWHQRFLTVDQGVAQYKSQSQPFFALVYWFWQSLTHSHYFHRVLTFLMMGMIHVLFYLIVKSGNFFKKSEAFGIAIICAAFPIYYSRMCLSIHTYTTALFLFIVAFYLCALRKIDSNRWLRLLSLTCFFFSFTLNSLIWAYLVPMWILFISTYTGELSRVSIHSIFGPIKKYPDFILLPFLFYFSHKYFFPKSGAFASYNDIEGTAFFHFFQPCFDSFKTGFLRVVRDTISWPQKRFILGLALISLFFRPQFDQKRFRRNIFFLAASVGLFFFLIFPYGLVGRVIEIYYIGDRSAILTIFASAAIVYFTIATLFSFARWKAFKGVAVVLCLFAFIHANNQTYYSFLRAAIKQDAITQNISSMPEFLKGRTFYFEDRTAFYVANQTPYEDSSLIGLMRFVFGTSDRCGSNSLGACMATTLRERSVLYYNVDKYIPGPDEFKVTIDYGTLMLDFGTTLELTMQKMLNSGKYYMRLNDVLIITAQSL